MRWSPEAPSGGPASSDAQKQEASENEGQGSEDSVVILADVNDDDPDDPDETDDEELKGKTKKRCITYENDGNNEVVRAPPVLEPPKNGDGEG